MSFLFSPCSHAATRQIAGMSKPILPQTHGELNSEGWFCLGVRCLTCGHTADFSLMNANPQTPAKNIGATASRIVCKTCTDNDLYARNLEFQLMRPELTGSHYDKMYGRPVSSSAASWRRAARIERL
jgi:hypothetical protein